MVSQPSLETKRLILRPLTLEDCARVQELAGDKRIADVTANVPHPYPDGHAEKWITAHPELWNSGQSVCFAITLKDSNLLIGAIALSGFKEEEGSEVGYWLGADYWGKGFVSEACQQVVEFGFSSLGLKRIHARHLSRNPASGKVLLNSGFTHIASGDSVCGYRKENESTEYYEIKFEEY